MNKEDINNYNTIQPILTYRSRIVHNKNIKSNNLDNLNSNNDNNFNNKIEKTLTQIISNDNNNIKDIKKENKHKHKESEENPKKNNIIRKNLSSYDIFIPKIKKIKNNPISQKNNQKKKHITFNDIKKKKRNNSLPNKTNKINISNKFSNNSNYKYACVNCYNNKIATQKLSEQPLEQKVILNNTFNKMDPFYFQEKMKDIYKDKINHKIKELEKIQSQVLNNLAKYKLENPTNVEKLQNQNAKSINPMISHEREDPRIGKTLRAYDEKEKIINDNKNLYQFDKPRKAINDYYKKCVFQIPKIEQQYMMDPMYSKQISEELRKQIEEKKINKKLKKEEEINKEKISNKKIESYHQFLKKKI